MEILGAGKYCLAKLVLPTLPQVGGMLAHCMDDALAAEVQGVHLSVLKLIKRVNVNVCKVGAIVLSCCQRLKRGVFQAESLAALEFGLGKRRGSRIGDFNSGGSEHV